MVLFFREVGWGNVTILYISSFFQLNDKINRNEHSKRESPIVPLKKPCSYLPFFLWTLLTSSIVMSWNLICSLSFILVSQIFTWLSLGYMGCLFISEGFASNIVYILFCVMYCKKKICTHLLFVIHPQFCLSPLLSVLAYCL